jgi:hypothetical protein
VAHAAGSRARDTQGRGDPGHGVLERQVEVGLEIASPLRAAPTAGATRPAERLAAAEEVAEQVVEVEAGVERGAARTEAAAAPAEAGERPGGHHLADAVVLLALLGVRQHRVGLADLLEALLGLRVVGTGVGVQLAGQLAVRLGDLLRAGALVDTEDLVVVLLDVVALAHRASYLPVVITGRPSPQPVAAPGP